LGGGVLAPINAARRGGEALSSFTSPWVAFIAEVKIATRELHGCGLQTCRWNGNCEEFGTFFFFFFFCPRAVLQLARGERGRSITLQPRGLHPHDIEIHLSIYPSIWRGGVRWGYTLLCCTRAPFQLHLLQHRGAGKWPRMLSTVDSRGSRFCRLRRMILPWFCFFVCDADGRCHINPCAPLWNQRDAT